MKGKLILLFGPTGSGKGTLIDYLRVAHPEFAYPISCTTRATKRPGEQDGVTYYFITPEDFQARIDRGDFLEWESFGGNMYGTLKSEVLTPLENGKTVIREVDVRGVRSFMKLIPRENLSVIFIDAGSWEELRERAVKRSPLTEEELEKRHKRYEDEVSFKSEADFIVRNETDKRDLAKEELERIIAKITSN